jgi:hypothetical protein
MKQHEHRPTITALPELRQAELNQRIPVIQEDNTSMPTPIVFEDVAPVVPVRDLQAALERYRQLGFEVRAYGHGTDTATLSGEPY